MGAIMITVSECDIDGFLGLVLWAYEFTAPWMTFFLEVAYS